MPPTPMTHNPDIPILNRWPTNNPYLEAVRLIKDRLRWDIYPRAWSSRRQLRRQWHNRFTGQKCVVVCNGPSLLKADLSRLNGTFTFGLNKINLLFPRSEFRPSCIVAINPLVIEQNAGFYNQTTLPLFLDGWRSRKWIKNRENILFLHTTSARVFVRDCSQSLYHGHTVTFVALQLAYHMGFQEVALIGCDHNFVTRGPADKAVPSGVTDPNHFDPTYFSGGVPWHLPNLIASESAYLLALELFSATGRRLVNATEGGNLALFPRCTLESFIKGSP